MKVLFTTEEFDKWAIAFGAPSYYDSRDEYWRAADALIGLLDNLEITRVE